jgi:hypothetical protein
MALKFIELHFIKCVRYNVIPRLDQFYTFSESIYPMFLNVSTQRQTKIHLPYGLYY